MPWFAVSQHMAEAERKEDRPATKKKLPMKTLVIVRPLNSIKANANVVKVVEKAPIARAV